MTPSRDIAAIAAGTVRRWICALGFHRWGAKRWQFDDIDWAPAYKRRCERCRVWGPLVRKDGKSEREAWTAVAVALRQAIAQNKEKGNG